MARNIALCHALLYHRGPVRVGMLIREDVVYVRAVRQDVIDVVSRCSEGAASWSVKDGVFYVDAGHRGDDMDAPTGASTPDPRLQEPTHG